MVPCGSISVTVDDVSRLNDAIAELEAIGRVEVRSGLAVVAVVGEGAPQRLGLAGHVFTLLGGVGVGVEMISQGDVLYSRLGGTFYDFGKREYVGDRADAKSA